jgi:hypothetical protein
MTKGRTKLQLVKTSLDCSGDQPPMWFTSFHVLLLLQSALQPLWVLACPTIIEYSQQEGFYRVPLPAARQTPQLGGPVIRTSQLPPPGVPHTWNNASEPQQRKVELWARNGWEFCWKWRLPCHFWVLLHAVNVRHGTGGFTSSLKEGVLRIFSPEKSDGFGRVWTRELGYQRPARLPLDHQSRSYFILTNIFIFPKVRAALRGRFRDVETSGRF